VADLRDVRYSWRGYLRRCATTSEWNVEGGRQCVVWLVSWFSFGYFDGLLD